MFLFKQKTAYGMRISDWSSDVCSSDLSMLQRLGLEEGEAIIHPWINKALEKAQQKVEARNYEIRKNLLKFDDVMNDQRKVIYEQRIEMMSTDDLSETVADMRHEIEIGRAHV